MTVNCSRGEIRGTRFDVCNTSRARSCSCPSDSFLYELTGPSGNNVWSNEIGWRDSINRENRIAIKSLVVTVAERVHESMRYVCACPVRRSVYLMRTRLQHIAKKSEYVESTASHSLRRPL